MPVIGEPADLANAAWYEAEGDHVNAALSAASAVPLLGYGASAVKAAKYAKKGVDAVETAQDATTAARTASKFCVPSVAGPRVVMGDGSHKAISKVRVGDRVQARDPQTGQRVAKPVVALFVHPDVLVRLRIGKQVLTTTVDHRFWNSDAGRYQRADHLAMGDRVLGTDGRLLPAGQGDPSLQRSGRYGVQLRGRRHPHLPSRPARHPRPQRLHAAGQCRKRGKANDEARLEPRRRHQRTYSGRKPACLVDSACAVLEERGSRSSVWDLSEANLARMGTGRAPQRYTPDKGGIESMELSHEPIPYRDGGATVTPRWPQEHAAIDPYRYPGY